MGKKRRDGRASKRGNNSASSNAGARNSDGGLERTTATGAYGTIHYDNGTYVGELEDGMPHGKGRINFYCGEVYVGELKDGKPHGKGKLEWEDGRVYAGEFENERHGWGIMTWPSGQVYEGQWKAGKKHGKGALKYSSGDVYEGQWVEEEEHGRGTLTWKDGKVYEGEFENGAAHGRGTAKFPTGEIYDGEWVKGKQHGKGTMKLPSGEIAEGVWREGELATEDVTNYSPPGCSATGESSLPKCGAPVDDPAPEENREHLNERTPRSQRSQQHRLQRNAATKTCEHCGVGDDQYKLRVCSGCNLALYCSPACQKAASRSHRRICDIISELPSRDDDRLVIEYDREKMVDLDAGLRYATKYMTNLKHLQIDVKEMASGDAIKLSAKQLPSLLRSKNGVLESVIFLSDERHPKIHGIVEANTVWNETHCLKQLRLAHMRFRDVQLLLDIIGQQKDTLEVLSLPELVIDWRKAKCRRAIALTVNSCKHLVKLDLQSAMLMDPDLKIMLSDLPNLRILDLTRHSDNSHEFTDNTCGLIARKCPGLQALNLHSHDQLSVRGIRKIFERCVHLRSFTTTTCKLSYKDLQTLLNIAPLLMWLSLGSAFDASHEEVSSVVEATGGRTLIYFSASGSIWDPDALPALSFESREKYLCQKQAFSRIVDRTLDPGVVNEWDE